jgi:hypothetical protein
LSLPSTIFMPAAWSFSEFHCENQGWNNRHVLWFCSNALSVGLRQREVVMKWPENEFRNGT